MNGLNWKDICALNDVIPGTGVAALVEDQQIAIVRSCDGDAVYAVSNFDPFSQAYVMARGIVGSRGAIPKVVSPIYKQSFDLRTGVCLDDPTVSLAVYPARVQAGRIQICISEEHSA
ncbi:MAG TPA: nitrite reductase small subunit NirD [Polyangiaceae bacterium]